MKKSMPKFHETFIPILSVLKDGNELHNVELKVRVRDIYFSDLSEELLLKKTNSGQQLILNRIGWGQSYLKQGKFVEIPNRGYVKITAKGLESLKRGSLTYAELKDDVDYLESQNNKELTRDSKEHDAEQTDYSPQDLIEEGFQSIKQNVRSNLLERLKNIDPFYFEKVILILLKKMGYGEFVETKKTGDGGIDGIMNQDHLGISKIYIQAKRYSDSKVREPEIRNFIGAMSGDTANGVFVTTSSFDESAIKKAKEAHHKIILVDGNKLTELMYEFGVGIQTVNIYELKEVDANFFEESL